MRVITKSRLKKECLDREDETLAAQIDAWYSIVSHANWANANDLKRTFGNASLVGDCVVFNVCGNKYRLVVRVRFQAHKVYFLKLMTHEEYNANTWKAECGCYSKPPAPKATGGVSSVRRKGKRNHGNQGSG